MADPGSKNTLLTVPIAILIGAIIISISILMHGGIIKVAGLSTLGKTGNQPATQAPTAPQAPSEPTVGPVEPLKAEDHIRGDRNARILLFEYADLECPFCKRFHPTAKQIVDTYKGQVAWVYRHFPLSFHANAQKEAEAIECANEQGGNDAFWKYTDTIFERTTSNGTGFALDNLVPLAKELGLNETQFKNCLDNGKYTAHVKADEDGGTKAGVTGTPGNILLDTKTKKTKLIPGALPFDQFKTAIDDLLKS